MSSESSREEPTKEPTKEPTGRTATPLDVLVEVQDLDTVISQLQHRKAALEERRQLASVEETLAALERRRAAALASRTELATRQSDLETKVAATASRRAGIEQRLYAARGAAARDLQAMNEEIGHLDARREELEDEELEIMVALEPIDAELAALATQRAQLTEHAGALRRALAARDGAIDAELASSVAARTALASSLPEELHRRYEVLRARLGGIGAARLVGNRCSGCHLELPSMEIERIRHLPPGTVVTCEQCGRILVPSSGAAASGPSPPDDTGPHDAP
jgi:hypothetical protein